MTGILTAKAETEDIEDIANYTGAMKDCVTLGDVTVRRQHMNSDQNPGKSASDVPCIYLHLQFEPSLTKLRHDLGKHHDRASHCDVVSRMAAFS